LADSEEEDPTAKKREKRSRELGPPPGDKGGAVLASLEGETNMYMVHPANINFFPANIEKQVLSDRVSKRLATDTKATPSTATTLQMKK